jgi:cytochrome c
VYDKDVTMRSIAILPLVAALLTPQVASAAGDAALGGKMFLQCRACHTIAAADRNGIGPNLNSIVGAKAASRSGFTYSPALVKAGIVWTPDKLDAFLTRPSALVPGTKMAFAGIANPKSRADMIAYLATLKR